MAHIGHLAWGMRFAWWSENLTRKKADQAALQLGLSPGKRMDSGKAFRAVSKAEFFSRPRTW